MKLFFVLYLFIFIETIVQGQDIIKKTDSTIINAEVTRIDYSNLVRGVYILLIKINNESTISRKIITNH